MGDDFDLFPKRENLDPFAFGKKEKKDEPEKADGGDELFGQEEPTPGPLPDLPPPDLSPEPPAGPPPEGGPLAGDPEPPPPLPDLPLGGSELPEPAPASGQPPLVPPPSPTPPMAEAAPDPLDSLLSDGPISEEKTFDEPVFEQEQVKEEEVKRRSRKSPSPFVVVGGALIIIIGLLYGALTYLKREKAPVISTPQISVPVTPPRPEPAPAPEPGSATAEVQPPGETIQPAEPEPASPSAPTSAEASPSAEATGDKTGDKPEPEPVPSSVEGPAPEPSPAIEPAAGSPPAPAQAAESTPQAVVSGSVQYSVQVGAFILDSSVAELEQKLRGLGYDPFLKKGSTTAMMNMLTVGPFNNVNDARTALSRLKNAGVDSNMRRRNDGGAVINAGSYLLEENATSVMKKIRSLGYPVRLYKREARLPMTFVRVGRYSGMSDATTAREQLKGKGLDGIVVKLQ